MRVIKVPLESGIDEYLVTSVFDESLTASDFKELYFMRWSIKLNYNELKNQFLLEEFSGATSTSIEQEFFINLLLSNIASLLKKAADEKIEEKTRRTNKFRYQANRAFIISMVKWYLPRFITTQFTIDKLDDLLNDAIKKRSQKQPGRNDKRNKKHSDRERKHFNNRKQVI